MIHSQITVVNPLCKHAKYLLPLTYNGYAFQKMNFRLFRSFYIRILIAINWKDGDWHKATVTILQYTIDQINTMIWKYPFRQTQKTKANHSSPEFQCEWLTGNENVEHFLTLPTNEPNSVYDTIHRSAMLPIMLIIPQWFLLVYQSSKVTARKTFSRSQKNLFLVPPL